MNARSRTVLAATALAAALATAPAHAAGEVLAHGHLSGGVCVYPPDVHVPAGTVVRSDAACDLIVVGPAELDTDELAALTARPGPDRMPKTYTGSTDGLAGAAGDGAQLAAVPSNLSGLDAAQAAVTHRTRRAIAWQRIYDRTNRLVYSDLLSMLFERRVSDGTMRGFAMDDGVCATGGEGGDIVGTVGPAPYDPYVDWYCWAELDSLSPKWFEFGSGGWYGTRAGAWPVEPIQYDSREMQEHWVADEHGFLSYLSWCDLSANPPEWYRSCVLAEVPADSL